MHETLDLAERLLMRLTGVLTPEQIKLRRLTNDLRQTHALAPDDYDGNFARTQARNNLCRQLMTVYKAGREQRRHQSQFVGFLADSDDEVVTDLLQEQDYKHLRKSPGQKQQQ